MRKMALALAICAAPAGARQPPAPTGELVLDIGDPVIAVRIGGVPLRLRVELDQKDVVELNPAAAARLPVAFGPGFDAEVGRVTLAGVGAAATLAIAGRLVPVQLSSHGRDCCVGVDGAIGPALLPYARVRFARAGAPPLAPSLDVVLDAGEDGLALREGEGKMALFVQFSLGRADTVATSSAGAILAATHGGTFEGGYRPTIGAFGIARPTRTIAFAREVALAGFRFARVSTRIADFGGGYALPAETAERDDIVVRRRIRAQAAWPAVLIGRDRLDLCAEILYETKTRWLTLRCAVGRPDGSPPVAGK